ncbi:hypothetical protein C8R34_10179 [Nitrosomonas sp. Nm84]|uniref:hypothetical protein n=1 Tax=Nitrosomonas sp. Nm84 TaxID=200124 RepID=UPI000D763AE7|nr:hypothetical protein [Nitrosomonas sp. Nm84]PXW91170.1 hypothetical protein C8R34_10179 [Nitrosomonas sp. Nm84]
MKRIFFIAGLITAFVLPINNAFSAAITFTYADHGSGNLDGTLFFDADFTIAASINISDVGNLTFTTPTRFFVNNTVNTVGFSHGGI